MTNIIGINSDPNNDWITNTLWRNLRNCMRLWGTPTSPNVPLTNPTLNQWGFPTVDFGTIFAFPAQGGYPTGQYQVRLLGQGQLFQNSSGTPVPLVNGLGTVTLTANQGNWFSVTGTSPSNPITAFDLMAPGYAIGDPNLFTPAFLQNISGFACMRMMGIGCTNGNTLTTWASRVTPAMQQTNPATGMCLEYQVALANQIGCDLWVNIPYGATQDYVAGMAALVSAQLNPDLNIYVELSNELWNTVNVQTMVNYNIAQSDPRCTATDHWGKAFQEIGLATYEVLSWWKAATSRAARFVINGQCIDSYIASEALGVIDATYGAGTVAKTLYGVAIAPYILYDSSLESTLTLATLFPGMNAYLTGTLVPSIQAHATLAKQYWLELLAYEGGQGLEGGVANETPAGNQAKLAAQTDPRMGTLYQALQSAWTANGGGLFNWFSHCELDWHISSTIYGGFWGLQQFLNDGSIKYATVKGMIPPPAPPADPLTGLALMKTYASGKVVTTPVSF
jgi:hypothetical protein